MRLIDNGRSANAESGAARRRVIVLWAMRGAVPDCIWATRAALAAIRRGRPVGRVSDSVTRQARNVGLRPDGLTRPTCCCSIERFERRRHARLKSGVNRASPGNPPGECLSMRVSSDVARMQRMRNPGMRGGLIFGDLGGVRSGPGLHPGYRLNARPF